MILRHEEAVAVDEGGLDQRAHRFPKSEGDKLSLHHPQEPQVGMILARKGPRNSRRYIVAPKLDLLPLTLDSTRFLFVRRIAASVRLGGSSSRIRTSFFNRARTSSSSSTGASLRATMTRSDPDFSIVPHFFRLIHPVAIELYFSASFEC